MARAAVMPPRHRRWIRSTWNHLPRHGRPIPPTIQAKSTIGTAADPRGAPPGTNPTGIRRMLARRRKATPMNAEEAWAPPTHPMTPDTRFANRMAMVRLSARKTERAMATVMLMTARRHRAMKVTARGRPPRAHHHPSPAHRAVGEAIVHVRRGEREASSTSARRRPGAPSPRRATGRPETLSMNRRLRRSRHRYRARANALGLQPDPHPDRRPGMGHALRSALRPDSGPDLGPAPMCAPCWERAADRVHPSGDS